MTDPTAILQAFQELMDGEKLLWTGQPQPGHGFTYSYYKFSMLAFASVVVGFVLFAEGTSWAQGNYLGAVGLGIFTLPFWGSALLVIPLLLAYEPWKRKNTFYAVTTRRLLILSTALKNSMKAWDILSVSGVSNCPRGDHNTVIFSDLSPFRQRHSMPWPDFFALLGFYSNFAAFVQIEDGCKVAELVRGLRKE